ncbi:MAG TPA: hypothetical protein VKK31_21525 [Thermoanaerobaculia bacterium]|nr:hypothetical protein [Thermoanaerobaculia bacterium]
MEPPQPPPPPPASPFDPAPRPKTSGCPKPLIIGCLAILLIGGLALLGGFFYMAKNASRVLQWSLTQMENGVMAQLPKDVTPEEKDRLRQAFADVTAGLKAGRITPEQFQPVQFKVMEIARKGSNVTRQDVVELTAALEEVAGKRQGPAGSGTAPPP